MSNPCECQNIIIKVSEEGIDGNGIVGIELISEVGVEKTYRISFTNGTFFDFIVTDGSSIASIEKTGTDVLKDTYTITLTNGDTMSFQVVNGRGITKIEKTNTDKLEDEYTITFNDGTTTKITVTNGRGITKIQYLSRSGLVDTYKIFYNDDTFSTFEVTNGQPATHRWIGTTLEVTSASGTSSADLKGDKGDAATIAVGTVTTGAEGTNAEVENVGDEHDAKFNFKIPRGNTGNGISSITLLSTSGLDKTYRILMTDNTHFDFTVHDGNGIASITKTGSTGAVDHYRVTFTDTTYFDYDVTNGSDEWGAIVGTLSDQTDLQNALDNKAPVITVSASGDIVSIADGAPMPVSGLSVSIEAVQSGSGDPAPDNVRPITGWTGAQVTRTGTPNIWGGEKMADDMVAAVDNSTYCAKGEDADGKYVSLVAGTSLVLTPTVKFKPDTQYTVIIKGKKSSAGNNTANLAIKYTDGATTLIKLGDTIEANTIYTVKVTSTSGKSVASIARAWQSGTAYLYYESCGIFEGVHTVDEFVPYHGITLPISWQTEAGTVYGGMLDVLTGTLTVTHVQKVFTGANSEGWALRSGSTTKAYFTIGVGTNGTGVNSAIISNLYPQGIITSSTSIIGIQIFNSSSYNALTIYVRPDGVANMSLSDWRSFLASNNLQVVYELAPSEYTTYQLTPAQLSTLLGENHIWADCGDVALEYRADTKMYIERLTQPTEDDMIANDNIPSGKFFMVGNSLFFSTASIAAGEQIVPGTNCTALSLADALNNLNA